MSTKVETVPGNKKNALRAEPAIGTTNIDLTRSTPLADPRFQAQRVETSPDESTPRLGITGSGANTRITVPHKKLPDLPPPRNPELLDMQPRSRT